MAVISGGDFQLEVESAVAGVWNVVGDMHTFNNESRRGISNFPVFDKSTPYRKVGKPDESFTVDGYDNPTDAGQARLNTLESTGAEAHVRFTRDGAVGFRQHVLVTSRRYSTSAEDESLQGRSYEFMATDAKAAAP